MATLDSLLKEIRSCRECEGQLPHEPRPVLAAHRDAQILILGQAPGRRVHLSGVPWDDLSGERLRDWMGISKENFYDVTQVALVPMGFCFPGTGKSGDLPPRKECAQLWHERLLKQLSNVKLTLLLGRFAQAYVLGKKQQANLSETVLAWKQYTPKVLPLPHPSPRNNGWLKQRPWFVQEVVPYLKRRVRRLIG